MWIGGSNCHGQLGIDNGVGQFLEPAMTNVKQFLCHNHFTLILDRNNRLYFTGEIKRIGSVYGGSQPTQILTDVIKIGKYYAGFYAILKNGSCLATVPEFNYIVRNKGIWFKFIEPTDQIVGGKWGNLIQQVFLKVNGIDYSSAIMDMKQKRDFNYLILTTDGHVFHISGVYKKMKVVTHGTDNILIDYCYDDDQVIRADANKVLHIETIRPINSLHLKIELSISELQLTIIWLVPPYISYWQMEIYLFMVMCQILYVSQHI